MPHGFPGLMSGAAIVFFAFIGFDAVSTTAEETRNPQRDMPIGIIASLIICTVLYVLMSRCAYRNKEIHDLRWRRRCCCHRFREQTVGAGAGERGRARRHDFSVARVSAWAAAHFHGDGTRRFIAAILRQNSSALPDAAHYDDLDWSCCRCRSDGYKHRRGRRPNEHRHALRVYFGLPRRQRASPRHPERPRPFRVPFVPVFPILGVFMCLALMLSLPVMTWIVL